MKKLLPVIAIVLASVVATWMVLVTLPQRRVHSQKKVVAELKQVLADQDRTRRINGGEPSPELLAMARKDPDFVMAFYVLEEAKHFPGMPEGLEKEVLKVAQTDSAKSLAMVRQAVYDGLSVVMVKAGENPNKGRIGWVNNNPATAHIFLEWPLAERLGKKTEFLTSHLKGTYRQEPYWHAPVTNQQMIRWWWGKWPLEGEGPSY